MSEYTKVGDAICNQAHTVYQLILDDHIPYIDPKSYNLPDEYDGVKPLDYFITSGDAVEKAKILEKDMWNLAGKLRKKVYELMSEEYNCSFTEAQQLYRNGKRPSNPPGINEYESEIWKSAGQARKLYNTLEKIRGTNYFLETEWDNHALLCITKNPRIQKD